MPARIKITLFFTAIVFTILGLVCTAVFYISYTSRINYIQTRLTNRAITTGRLLSQSETFNQQLIQKIDSLTAMALNNKTVQAYDYLNNKIYSFSDSYNDTLRIDKKTLDEARVKGKLHFNIGDKDAVAYHYTDANNRIVIVAAGYDAEGKKNVRQLFLILFLGFLSGTVIAFISGLFFSKRLLQPVRNIADEVNEISAHNLTRRILTGPIRDEWYYLSDTLNQLLNRLQDSFETQQRFIANASHELSTPLTSISSQLEVSLQRQRDAEEYRKVMQSVHQDVRHMNKLTQTLLEFAKASGSSGGLEITRIRIDEILLRLPAEMVKINNRYQVKLSFDELPEDEELLYVYGNEELLVTAIRNIVVNACKYSSNHTAIIKLETKASYIIITIEDKGAGIPEQELETIFEPFYRSAENRHTAEGFGLGLSLTNRIIKLHKGEIKVTSRPGKGTTFTLRLPSVKKLKNF